MKNALEPIVNWIIDKENKIIHRGQSTCVVSDKVVTAEDLNPAYLAEHGYKRCPECGQ